MLFTALTLVGVVGISSASFGMQQSFYEDPLSTGEATTGGEEDKKKDQPSEQETGEEGEASTAKDETPEEPAETPRKEEPKPTAAESKVNSFNFLFEMLYHFNLIETTQLYNEIDPSKEQFIVGMPVRQGRSTLVSR